MTVINAQVDSSLNDGFWDSSTTFNRVGYLYLGVLSGPTYQTTFLRWTGITIPAGATISSAYLSLYFNDKVGTPPAVNIYFEDAVAPTQISSRADGLSRALTTAYVAATPPLSGTWWNSPDISTIIQELVNSYTYSSGVMQAIITTPSGTSGNWINWKSYDKGASYGATLTIDYVAGCPRQAMYFKMMG